MASKTRVLFVCVANSARSQMAEALLRHLDGDTYEAFSAGSAPTQVDYRALRALEALAIPVGGLRSKSLQELAGQTFDYVITLCDKSALECHALPGAGEFIAWDFEDPVTSRKPDAYRQTLQDIQERLKMFLLVKRKNAVRHD